MNEKLRDVRRHRYGHVKGKEKEQYLGIAGRHVSPREEGNGEASEKLEGQNEEGHGVEGLRDDSVQGRTKVRRLQHSRPTGEQWKTTHQLDAENMAYSCTHRTF